MTAFFGSPRRLALAATFVAILIGAIYATENGAQVVASLAGSAIAILFIAAAVISWERTVVTAQSTGLVAPEE
jgi:hypothetical protein